MHRLTHLPPIFWRDIFIIYLAFARPERLRGLIA